MNTNSDKTKEQLLAELTALRKKSKAQEDKLKAANQQLDAQNQQLQATEQQLRAANQQLDASNQQLIASEQELKKEKIVETTDAIIVGLDKDHIIRIFNRGAENITAYKKKEVIGKDWFKIFFPKEMLDEMNKVWKDTWGVKSHSYINPILSKTGEVKIISWQSTSIYESDDVLKHMVLSIGEDITERKQAEDALASSEERLKILFELAPDAYYIIDKKGNFIDVNKASERILGYNREELIGKNFTKLNLLTSKDLPPALANLAMYLLGKSTGPDEYTARRKDGVLIHAEVRTHPVKIAGKRVLLVIARDITERKQVEKALRESEAKFRSIVENASPVIFTIDKEGKFLLSEGKSLKPLGLKPGQVVGMSAFEIYKDYPAILKGIKEALAGNTFRDVIEIGDVYFEIFYTPNKDDSGYFDSIIGMAIDITERKQAEAELTKLSTAVKQSPSIVIITDTDGNIEYANPKFTELTGYSLEEVIGQNPRILKSGYLPDKMYKELWETILSGKTWRGEFHNKKKNGKLFWESASVSPIFDKQGKIINYIKVAEDNTEKKKTEQELIKAKEKAEESNRLKTAFLNNMSHEIRTPLNGITGFISLLQDAEIDDEEKQEYFDIINQSSDRLIATVTDIMDISRIEAGEVKVSKSEVSVNEILEEQYEFFYHEAKSKGIELNYKPSLSDREARFVTDKHKLEGILTNLIKNAIKFTDQGEITFACSLKKEQDFEFLEFYVKDTGIGIPANRVDAIFNRFEQADISDTRAFQGSGLGLAITKSYVEMLGGKISVKSKEGEGSTFIFSLPYTKQLEKESDAKKSINKEPHISLNHLSLIIAEDDETSQLFYKAIFKNKFKKITYTTTGKETIEKFRKNPDTDIILMDIQMPDMNGYDATREIRKFNANVVIIAQTAFGLAGDRKKALEAGCNDYIAKPVKKEKLFEKIRACLDKISIQ